MELEETADRFARAAALGRKFANILSSYGDALGRDRVWADDAADYELAATLMKALAVPGVVELLSLLQMSKKVISLDAESPFGTQFEIDGKVRAALSQLANLTKKEASSGDQHAECGRPAIPNDPESGPEHEDCGCRGTGKQTECANKGCGFCRVVESHLKMLAASPLQSQ